MTMVFAVDGIGLLGALGIGGMLALVVFFFASQADEKAVVRLAAPARGLRGRERP